MADFTIPLDISSLKIIEQTVDTQGNYILVVESKKTESKCHKCGKSATKRYGCTPPIQIRHLPVLDTPVFLEIRPVRYQCEHCDDKTVTTEQYDWCDRNSKTTKPLDDYLTRCMINSTVSDVSRKERISYKTVIKAMDSKVNKTVDWSKYTDLTTLGIDEISDKKGHKDFLTIVSVKSKKEELSVIAVLPDRQKETVKSFLESIPAELKKTVKSVCTDMYDGFVYAATEVFGQQAVVIDRYHVAKLYRKPLDTLRIQEMKRFKKELSAEEYSELEGVMWILRKSHECLTKQEKEKLELLYKYSPTLKSAHSYALKLTQIFNSHSSRKLAYSKLKRWIVSIEKSELECFNSFIVTLNKYRSGIANYFKQRKNSGFVEGLNNKIKVIKRRCYGFFKTESLFQRLFLDLLGYKEFYGTN
jgi:transposase